MTREVDSHSDPCMQSIARPTHHHRGRPPLVGRPTIEHSVCGVGNLSYIYLFHCMVAFQIYHGDIFQLLELHVDEVPGFLTYGGPIGY